jgi:hypothetical protein
MAGILVEDLQHRLLGPGAVAGVVEREEELEAAGAGGLEGQIIPRVITLVIGRVEGKGVDVGGLGERDVVLPGLQGVVWRVGDLLIAPVISCRTRAGMGNASSPDLP